MNDLPDFTSKVFETWQLHHKHGSGNSGDVYLAIKGDQTAAVKIFHPSLIQALGEAEPLARIERELKVMPTDHPSLVPVLDGGRSRKGFLYIVMKNVEGVTLERAAKHIPPDRIAPIIAQIADAAHYLEKNLIVHRDIKPANIIVDGAFRRATLIDYGVIRPIAESTLANLTSTGDFVGTLRYSPPEFVTGRHEFSVEGWRAITFYQLGAVLHDLITGKQLFSDIPRHDLGEVIKSVVPDLSEANIRKGVPSELVELARNCLRKDPTERLKTVSWEKFECRRFVRRPIVVLVYTGGTVGAVVDEDGTNIRNLRVIESTADPFLADFRRRIIRDHQQVAGPDIELPFDLLWEMLPPDQQLLSENASHETWEELGKLIERICAKYAPPSTPVENEEGYYLAGIVVLHGTDTLAHSAAAVFLSLSNLPCPIVLTGSNQPPNEQTILERDLIASESDAWKNVLLSLHFIQAFGHRFPEVFVCFNDTVHVAVNLRKTMIDRTPEPLHREPRVLQEPYFYRNYGPLRQYAYRIVDGLHCNNFYPISRQLTYAVLTGDQANELRHYRKSPWSPERALTRDPFASGVRFLPASPLAFLPADSSNCKILLLEGFESGTFPTAPGHPFRNLLLDLKRNAIPVVLVTRDGLIPTTQRYAMSLEMPILRLFGLIAETAAPLLSLILAQIPAADWEADSLAVADRLDHRLGLLEKRIRDYQRLSGGIFKDLLADILNPDIQRAAREHEIKSYEDEHTRRVTTLFAESKANLGIEWRKRRPFDPKRTILARQHFLWLLSELVHTFGTSHSGPDGLAFWNEFGFAWGGKVRETVTRREGRRPSADRLVIGSRIPFAQQGSAEQEASVQKAETQVKVISRFLYDHGVAELVTTLDVKKPTETTHGRLTLEVSAQKYGQGGRDDELYAALGYGEPEAQLFRMLRTGADPTLKGDECVKRLEKHFRELYEHALDYRPSPLDWFLIGTYKALMCGILRKLHFDPWVDRCDANEPNHVEALRRSIETRLEAADANSVRFRMIYAGRGIVEFS